MTATHVYWTNSGLGATTIGRANLDGSDVDQEFIDGLNRPVGIAVDATHIFWTETTGEIGRANLNGGEVDSEFIETGAGPGDVTIDPAHIYWTDSNGKVGRANLDGSGIDGSFIADSFGTRAVEVNREHIYWTNIVQDRIGRANLDGSGVDLTFIAGAAEPRGIAVSEPLLPAPVPTEPAQLRLVKIVRDKKRGTAKLVVYVSGPGTVRLAASRKIKGATKNAKAAGTLKLPLIPKGKAKTHLLERGRVKVLAKVTFTPAEGDPVARSWRRPLIRRLASG